MALKFNSLNLLHAAIRGCDMLAKVDAAARVPSYYPCRTLALSEVLTTILGHIPITGATRTTTTTKVDPATGIATTTTTTMTISGSGDAEGEEETKGEQASNQGGGAGAGGSSASGGNPDSKKQPWELPTSRQASVPEVAATATVVGVTVAEAFMYVTQALALLNGSKSTSLSKEDATQVNEVGVWPALVAKFGKLAVENAQRVPQFQEIVLTMCNWATGALDNQLQEAASTSEVLNKMVHHHPSSGTRPWIATTSGTASVLRPD